MTTLCLISLNLFLIVFLLLFKQSECQKEEPREETILEALIKEYKSILHQSFLEKPIDLFLPKYDMQRPHKFRKTSHKKIMKHLSDYKRRTENLKDLFVFPEEEIEENESNYKKEVLDALIKREVNIDDTKFSQHYTIFGFPNSKAFQNEIPKLLENEHSQIKNFADLGDVVTFEPKQLNLIEK